MAYQQYRLFEFVENSNEGVTPVKAAILINEEDGKKYIQLKLHNQMQEVLNKVVVRISCFDKDNNFLGSQSTTYKGKNIKEKIFFGTDKAIPVEYEGVENISVECEAETQSQAVSRREYQGYIEKLKNGMSPSWIIGSIVILAGLFALVIILGDEGYLPNNEESAVLYPLNMACYSLFLYPLVYYRWNKYVKNKQNLLFVNLSFSVNFLYAVFYGYMLNNVGLGRVKEDSLLYYRSIFVLMNFMVFIVVVFLTHNKKTGKIDGLILSGCFLMILLSSGISNIFLLADAVKMTTGIIIIYALAGLVLLKRGETK